MAINVVVVLHLELIFNLFTFYIEKKKDERKI